MVVVRISVALGGQSPEECGEPLCLGRGSVLSASLWYLLTMCQGPSLHAAPGCQALSIFGTGQHLCTNANNIQEIEAFLRNGEI